MVVVPQAPKLSIVLGLDQRQYRHGQRLFWTVQARHAAVYDPDEVRLLALAARYEARCPCARSLRRSGKQGTSSQETGS